MKTVVLGLFDRLEDAEQVLAQLAHSPLDLDAVQVLNADMDLQRRLSDDAGLPSRRSLRTGLVTGAIAGAGLGFLAGWVGPDGAAPLLAGPGPLLAMSGGSLLGALAGAVGGALSESNRLPEAHSALALAGLAEGATMVTVRTENEPTARAIGDLFRAGGSRTLEALDPMPSSHDRDAGYRPPADAEAQAIEMPIGPPSEDALPEAHTPFAPPWRREGGEALPAATSGGMLFPQAETEAAAEIGDSGKGLVPGAVDDPFAPPATIRHGETVISVDRSTREVEPREVEPREVLFPTARFAPDPIEGLGGPAGGEAPIKADPKPEGIKVKKAAKVNPVGPAKALKTRRSRPPRTEPDPADRERLESAARDLMREIFGGSGGSRKA
jgi:hypothetical protein